jgi:3-deoxy-manno-octulosonate cytidylyltransferase (CMP-KDO synthetase)
VHLLIVIPARLGSTRIPSKPLRLLAGEPLVCAVARRVVEFALDARIVVASDDERVLVAVAPLGVEGVLTSAAHGTGTERVAAVAGRPEFHAHDTVLNVQGDEPFMRRYAVVGALERVAGGDPVGTAAVPLERGAVADSARVTVVVDKQGRALDFVRAVPASNGDTRPAATLQHVGVYAYSRAALAQWARLPVVREELDEGLEQLRPLRHGINIGVAAVPGPAWRAIDTEADLAIAEVR